MVTIRKDGSGAAYSMNKGKEKIDDGSSMNNGKQVMDGTTSNGDNCE